MLFKTDYAGHDWLYHQYRRKGQAGWDDDQTWQVWRAEIEVLMANPAFPKSGSVLELGCGAGDVALLFADRGYSVFGIDIAPSAIEWALEKAEGRKLKAEFLIGDVTDLGRWPDGNFDIIIDGHCLHCIIGKDRGKVLRETYRVLKPGGLFYVSTMCGEPKEPEVLKQYDTESRCMIGNGAARRYFGKPDDILAEITQAGFKPDRHVVKGNEQTQDDLLVWARK